MARKAKAKDMQSRVLLVEDEYFIAVEVVKALESEGIAAVGPTGSVKEALRMIESGPIDAAILDISLRSQPVYPLADELEARKVPYVFATGYGEQAIPKRFRHVPCFEKPLDLGQLVKAVTRH
jgi:DNA-binding NtrC family response regulator